MLISAFDSLENIVGKGEKAFYQHFHLFPLCFPKASFFMIKEKQGLFGKVLKHAEIIVKMAISYFTLGSCVTHL